MTQPNPDQPTIDSVSLALVSALPLLQAKTPTVTVAPLETDGLVAAAQAILDYANGTTTAPDAPSTNDPR